MHSDNQNKGVNFMQQNKSIVGGAKRDSISLEDEEYGDMINDYYKKRGDPITTKRITSQPHDQKLEMLRGRVESSYKNNLQVRASSQYQSAASSSKEKGLERSDRTLLDRRKIVVKHGLAPISRPLENQPKSRIKPIQVEPHRQQEAPYRGTQLGNYPDFYNPRSPRDIPGPRASNPVLYGMQPLVGTSPQKKEQYVDHYGQEHTKKMDKNPSFGPSDRGAVNFWNMAPHSSSNNNSRVSSSILRPLLPPLDHHNARSDSLSKPVSDWELEEKLKQHLKIAEQLRERGRMFRESKKYSDELLIESILSDGYKQTMQDHIKEWNGSRVPQSYLEYNKSRAKPSSKVGEFNEHIRHIADESKSHEVNEYAMSNLHRFDQEAALEPIRFKHLQKRNILSGINNVRLPSGQKEHPENKYLESIRAKFGFLEGVIYSGSDQKPKGNKPGYFDPKGLK